MAVKTSVVFRRCVGAVRDRRRTAAEGTQFFALLLTYPCAGQRRRSNTCERLYVPKMMAAV